MPIDLNEHLKKKRAQIDEKSNETKREPSNGNNGGGNRPNG